MDGLIDGSMDRLVTKVGYTWVPLSPFHPCPCALQGKLVHLGILTSWAVDSLRISKTLASGWAWVG